MPGDAVRLPEDVLTFCNNFGYLHRLKVYFPCAGLHATMTDACEGPCPRCSAEAVAFDDVQGIKVCESCGNVLEESELVQYTSWEEDVGPSGVFVAAGDSGRAAGAHLLPKAGVGGRIQWSSRDQGQVRPLSAGACGHGSRVCSPKGNCMPVRQSAGLAKVWDKSHRSLLTAGLK
jgi:hypothetical protein